ncbi:MAG: NTP transferase domain-containing protein, partial [Gemmatimonadaceae bacterium]
MIGTVILAAGSSTRFGSPKQLLVHKGQSLVRVAAKAATAA